MKRYDEGIGAAVNYFKSIRISVTFFLPLSFPEWEGRSVSLSIIFPFGQNQFGSSIYVFFVINFCSCMWLFNEYWIPVIALINRAWGISHLISELRWGRWLHFNSRGTCNHITAFYECLRINLSIFKSIWHQPCPNWLLGSIWQG